MASKLPSLSSTVLLWVILAITRQTSVSESSTPLWPLLNTSRTSELLPAFVAGSLAANPSAGSPPAQVASFTFPSALPSGGQPHPIVL